MTTTMATTLHRARGTGSAKTVFAPPILEGERAIIGGTRGVFVLSIFLGGKGQDTD